MILWIAECEIEKYAGEYFAELPEGTIVGAYCGVCGEFHEKEGMVPMGELFENPPPKDLPHAMRRKYEKRQTAIVSCRHAKRPAPGDKCSPWVTERVTPYYRP